MQICPPRPPQLALAPLLPSLRSDLAEAAEALTKRRALFESVIAEVDGWRVLSSGGFYAYVQFPDAYGDIGSEEVGNKLATQCGVLTLPGCFFMPPLDSPEWASIKGAEVIHADRWIRFAVANVSDETVAKVGERLRALNKIMGM